MFGNDPIPVGVEELIREQLLNQLSFMNNLIPSIKSGDRISKRALHVIEESHERLFKLFVEFQRKED